MNMSRNRPAWLLRLLHGCPLLLGGLALLLLSAAARGQTTPMPGLKPGEEQTPLTPLTGISRVPDLGLFSSQKLTSRADRLRGAGTPTAPTTPNQTGNVSGGSSILGESPSVTIDPTTYVLASGDQLLVTVNGLNDEEYPLLVSPEGTLAMPGFGEVRVNDCVYQAAKDRIRMQILKYRKDVLVTTTISRVRDIKIRLVGQVVTPGAYWTQAYSRVSEVLPLAGGIRDTGSVRQIQVQRDGAVIAEVDLARLILLGDSSQDIRLESGDTIYVPYVGSLIAATGEFKSPGLYEMLDGEGILDLLRFTGGLTAQAAREHAQVDRIGEKGVRDLQEVSLSDDGLLKLGAFTLHNGDRVHLPAIDLLQGELLVVGAVNGSDLLHYPEGQTPVVGEFRDSPAGDKFGTYKLRRGERLRTALWNVGGPAPAADKAHVRIERRKEDGTLDEIPIDLEALLDRGDDKYDVALLPGDRLVVPSLADRVYILGEVRRPMGYNYRANRSLMDYMGEAGGPGPRAKTSTVLVFSSYGGAGQYDIVDLGKQERNQEPKRMLQPGDVVMVPPTTFHGVSDALPMIFAALNIIRGLR